MSFKPTLLVLEEARGLRWMGRLLFNGLFGGEHYWELTRNPGGGTDISHREDFTGLLMPIFKPAKFKGDFERMNRDMAAEIARRYSARLAFAVAR